MTVLWTSVVSVAVLSWTALVVLLLVIRVLLAELRESRRQLLAKSLAELGEVDTPPPATDRVTLASIPPESMDSLYDHSYTE